MQELNLVFTPKKIGRLELKNRIIFPAITSGFGSSEGHISDALIAFHEKRARGGVGCIILEQACIHPSGKLIARTLRMDDDTYIPGFKKLAERVHSAGAKVVVQLNHTGRQTLASITGEQVMAPSPIPCPVMKQKPHALNREEISHLVNAFSDASVRVRESGCDGIEIQMGHGYLIAEFLSRYSNRRNDEYGGSLENRTRFALEIMSGIRKRCGEEFPVICKMSVDEMVPEGLSIEESQKIAKMLVKSGADAIFASVGCYESHFFNRPCFYQPDMTFVELASHLTSAGDTPVIACGKICEERMAEEILNEKRADFIAMGRPLVADPDFWIKAQRGDHKQIRPCIYCNRCTESTIQAGLRCTVNPELNEKPQTHSFPEKRRERILIAGGGPAGMEAAVTARRKGYEVILFDCQKQLGGKLLYQVLTPGREHLRKLIEYYEYWLDRLHVECMLNQECSLDTVRETGPDGVIVASGAVTDDFDSMSRPHVFNEVEALNNADRLQDRIAVVGGGRRGTAIADYFSSRGKKVAIIEKKRKIGLGLPSSVRFHLENRLKNQHVRFYTFSELLGIEDDCLRIQTDTRVEELRDFDSVILTHTRRPLNGLAEELKILDIPYAVIGDANKPGDLQKAISEGRKAGELKTRSLSCYQQK